MNPETYNAHNIASTNTFIPYQTSDNRLQPNYHKSLILPIHVSKVPFLCQMSRSCSDQLSEKMGDTLQTLFYRLFQTGVGTTTLVVCVYFFAASVCRKKIKRSFFLKHKKQIVGTCSSVGKNPAFFPQFLDDGGTGIARWQYCSNDWHSFFHMCGVPLLVLHYASLATLFFPQKNVLNLCSSQYRRYYLFLCYQRSAAL